MKTKTNAILLAMGLGFASAANASDESGVINFVGSVYTGACTVTIDVDGAGTTNATNLVSLAPIDGGTLTAVGAGGATQAFNLQLTGCAPDVGSVEIALTGDFVSNTDGVVNAVYDNGNNVDKLGFQIKANSTVVDWATDSHSFTGLSDSDAQTLPMTVGYYSLDANNAPGGIVRATVNYLVSYY